MASYNQQYNFSYGQAYDSQVPGYASGQMSALFANQAQQHMQVPATPSQGFAAAAYNSQGIQNSNDGAAQTTTTTTTKTTTGRAGSQQQSQRQQQTTASWRADLETPTQQAPQAQQSRIEVTGGRARQQAATKGATELQQFDHSVQQMLMTSSQSACPMGFRYYKCPDGYLCGGGGHFVSDESVDMVMFGLATMPFIELCNRPGAEKVVVPPRDGWHEPMHWDPETRLQNHMEPMPLKHDGKMWPGYAQYARQAGWCGGVGGRRGAGSRFGFGYGGGGM